MYRTTSLILLLLFANLGLAQQYSTGDVKFNHKFTARIDMTSKDVTLTTITPDDVWYSLGFGVKTMNKDGDTFLSNGKEALDAICSGYRLPTKDAQQDWTIISNKVSKGTRTMVVRRPLKTTDKTDYVFNPKANSLTLMWAVGNGRRYNRHTRGNYGATVVGITLSNEEFNPQQFQISPNPVNSSFTLSLPKSLSEAKMSVFNMLGKKIYTTNITKTNTDLFVSDWSKGVYLIKIDTKNGYSVTKKLIKK